MSQYGNNVFRYATLLLTIIPITYQIRPQFIMATKKTLVFYKLSSRSHSLFLIIPYLIFKKLKKNQLTC